MAGNYPDVPGPRLAYDKDGSIGFQTNYDTGGVTQISAGELASMNDEDNDGLVARTYNSHGGKSGIIFPELRDIVAWFMAGSGSAPPANLETSVDTTTGIDGTWVSRISGGLTYYGTVVPNYRTNIHTVSWSGIRAIRWDMGSFFDNFTVYAFHLYGMITAGESPDRLRLWHPTLDQPLDDPTVSPDGAYFDWGNAPQGTTATRGFRVKNNSSTLTAHSILISIDAPTDTTPAVAGQHTVNNGGSYGSTVNIGDLAPGVISSVCNIKRTTPSNAILGPWVARILAEAASWS